MKTIKYIFKNIAIFIIVAIAAFIVMPIRAIIKLYKK